MVTAINLRFAMIIKFATQLCKLQQKQEGLIGHDTPTA